MKLIGKIYQIDRNNLKSNRYLMKAIPSPLLYLFLFKGNIERSQNFFSSWKYDIIFFSPEPQIDSSWKSKAKRKL